MAPKSKRAKTLAEKMATRSQASVMDSTGTGDPAMDKLLRKETNRKAAFAGSMGVTAQGTTKGGNALSAAWNKMFGKKKKA